MVESVEIIIKDERGTETPEPAPLTREQISELSDKQYVDFKRSAESGDLDGFLERLHTERTATKKPAPLRQRARAGLSSAAGAAANPLAALQGVGRIIPGVGAAIAAAAFVRQIIDKQFGPGGPWDRRLDIRIENQVARFTDRQRLHDIASGRRVMHTVAAAGLRGRDGTIYSSASRRADVDINEYAVRGASI